MNKNIAKEPVTPADVKLANTKKDTHLSKSNTQTLGDNHQHLISPLDNQRVKLKKSAKSRKYDYDIVVLGAGPAGEAAAMKLAKSGKKVAVVDPRGQVGGNCVHVGTIPSKALRQSVFNLISYRRDPLFSGMRDNYQVPLNKVLSKARQVILSQVTTHALFYERNQVEVIHGWG